MLDRERLSSSKQLMNDRAMLGFEPAAFGRDESLVWKTKIPDGV